MKATKNPGRIWHGLTASCCALLAVSVGVGNVAGTLETRINSMLGTSSTKLVETGETQDTTYYASDFSSAEDLIAYRDNFNRTMVSEGTVLLKNENNVLPLRAPANITMFGIGGVSPIYAGSSGGGVVKNQNQIVPFTKVLDEAGFTVNPTVHSWYVKTGIPASCMVTGTDFSGNTTTKGPWDNEANEVATRNTGVTEADASAAFASWKDSYTSYGDAAIVMLCRYEGEGSDLPAGSLAISAEERALIDEAKANFDKVVVIVNSSAAIEIDSLKQDPDIDAILWVSELGTHGAYGLVDVLDGTVTPSGHLPDTYAVDSTSSPAAQNSGDFTFTNAESEGLDNFGSHYLVQAENIYLGYRYYETRYEDAVLGQGNANSETGSFASNGGWDYASEVSYGFGYGLSYTTFSQTLDSVNVDKNAQTITATVTVTNTGDVAGKDVVQVYAQSPYTDYDKQNGVEKSAVQLMGFGKTDTLEPGASQTVEVTTDMKYLASYDRTAAKTYILDAGDYYFAIGNGAHEALNNILAAKGKTTADGMTADGNADLTSVWHNDNLDTTTFAVGYDNVTPITNAFDEADYNTYAPDTITYLSRSDWAGTWSEAYSSLEATTDMLPWLKAEQYEAGDSDTSSITTGSTQTQYSLIQLRGAEYDDPLWDNLLNQITLDEMASLLTDACEHTNPVPSVSYQGSLDKDGPIGYDATFNTDTGKPYHIGASASDAVKNYNFASLSTEPTLAASFNLELANERGNVNGEDSLWSGYTENWAPGANLHRTPYSGRNYEYFSEDSMLSNLMAVEITRGTQAKGAVTGIKHFAGNDQETNRNGVATFYNEQGLRELQLRAFEGAFVPDEGNAHGTMTSFSRIGVQQAAYCESLLTTVLRDEWGFDGYTITDFAFNNLMYPYASLTAGTDAFDNMISDFSAINADALNGDLKLKDAAREATHRILYTYANSNAMNGVSSGTQIVHVTPWWKMTIQVSTVVFGVGTAVCLLMFAVSMMKRKKEEQ